MRESRAFAVRTRVLKSDEALKKIFLIFEGSDTELIYFEAINSMREHVRINPLIELIPVIRSYSEEGWSNPKKILDRLIENLEESKSERMSYETLLNRMIDYFYEAKIITTSKVLVRSIWKTMVRICTENLKKSLEADIEDLETDCNTVLELLKQEYDILHIISDISNIIQESGLTYAEGFDQICLIIDRDKESFLATPENNQYKYVADKCQEKGFHLCITNPCFEFWLLLHFDDVFELDTGKLLENPKITSRRRYAEHQFRRICPGYSKSSYDAEKLVKDVDKAIKNEKKFCEDIRGLENNVGSNIGRLIEDMQTS